MSERNFRRVFQQETGCSPSSFVENARLERAKQLLENLGSVPSRPWPPRSGWARSRRCDIVRKLGITPVAYRERFGD
jgi:AraC-like DNA-binding protein